MIDRCVSMSMSDGTFFEHVWLLYVLICLAVGSWHISSWVFDRLLGRFFERVERRLGGKS